MKDYVLDANAVLRYFGIGGGQGREKVRSLFEQAERDQARLSMSVVNMGEVLYVLLKHLGEERAFQYIQVLRHSGNDDGRGREQHHRGGFIETSLQAWLRGQLRRGSGFSVEVHARFRGPFVRKDWQVSQVDEAAGVRSEDSLTAAPPRTLHTALFARPYWTALSAWATAACSFCSASFVCSSSS